MKTTNTDESVDIKLVKLRERETALKQQAQQLEARAEHLSRVRRGHLERLARRVDAHEKIILGALVKKAGLDVCRFGDAMASKQQTIEEKTSSTASKAEDKDAVPGSTSSNQQTNDAVLSAIDCRVGDQSTNYDRELILGGLLWLVSVLNQAPGDVVAVPPHGALRDAGRLAGASVSHKKTGRPGI